MLLIYKQKIQTMLMVSAVLRQQQPYLYYSTALDGPKLGPLIILSMY